MQRPSLSNAIRRPAPSQLEPRKGSNARDAGTRDAGPIGPAAACAAVRSAPGRDRAESRPYTHFAGKDKQTRVVLSIAHELSGLGSTRVVRFSGPLKEGGDGPDTVATGPKDAEVQGCFEPLGAAGAVGNGRGGDSRDVGAAISALPAALRGRRLVRALGQ